MTRQGTKTGQADSSQELSSSRFTMIVGVTAVLFFLGLLPLEAIPEIPVDIDSKPFFIPMVLTALLPAGRPGVAIGLGVAVGEFLRDLMEGYELDDPIGFVGYFVAFALTSYLFGKHSPRRLVIVIAGLFCGFVQAAIEASSFLLFGEESMGIAIQSTIGNTIMHGIVWGAIPAFFLIPMLRGRFEHYLGFPTKGEQLDSHPLIAHAHDFNPSDEAIAWVAGVSFRYPSSAAPALQDLSLELKRGEVLGLIGPTMSGKSTLCRVMAEVAPRATGGDMVGDIHLGAQAADIGYVADTPSAMMTRTHALNEVEAGLDHLGLSRAEAQQRALKALADFGIGEDEARQYIWELPSNRQLMVALAAALASKPQLLILDELAAVLDASALQTLHKAIKRHCAAGGAVLLVDNDVDRQWAWADTVAIMQNGTITRAGRAQDVLAQADCLAAIGFSSPSALLAQDLKQAGTGTFRQALKVRDSQALVLEGICFAHPQQDPIFDGVSFTANAGEIVGIAAKSGGGKSTLAKMLGGIIEPQSGSITLATDSQTAGIAVVMHSPSAFFSERTVRDEISAGLGRARVDEAKTERLISELANQFYLTEVLDADPSRLPLGKARLAQIAAILASQARVLVLDEAVARLDPAERSVLIQTLCKFTGSGGSVIILDHDLDFLADIADRLCLIEGGRIVALGTVEQALGPAHLDRLRKADLAIPGTVAAAQELGNAPMGRLRLAALSRGGQA